MAATETKRFQIRDDDFGVAIYEAATAKDALLAFCTDQARAAIRADITVDDAGDATVTIDGRTFRAVG